MDENRKQYRAMQLDGPGRSLRVVERAMPVPGANEMLIKVLACGVCRTDLHIVDGEIPAANYPIVPGHEIIGRILQIGDRINDFAVGDRVASPGWVQAVASAAIA